MLFFPTTSEVCVQFDVMRMEILVGSLFAKMHADCRFCTAKNIQPHPCVHGKAIFFSILSKWKRQSYAIVKRGNLI